MRIPPDFRGPELTSIFTKTRRARKNQTKFIFQNSDPTYFVPKLEIFCCKICNLFLWTIIFQKKNWVMYFLIKIFLILYLKKLVISRTVKVKQDHRFRNKVKFWINRVLSETQKRVSKTWILKIEKKVYLKLSTNNSCPQ